MKKKIFMLTLVGLICSAAVVYAAGLWGAYKGNSIIRITVNGVPTKVTDIPAINYNNRTMIPIYMLKDAGINYTWDQKNQTVNITKNEPSANTISVNPIDALIKKHGPFGTKYLEYAEYMNNGNGFNQISINTTFDFYDPAKNAEYNAVLYDAYLTGANQIRFYNINSQYILFIKSENYKKFLDGTITNDEFMKTQEVVKNNDYTGQSTSTGTTSSNQSNLPTQISIPELYSNDGKTYLGKLTTNEYDSDSIFNEYGTYGSKYSISSIWNEYGTYGSEYSSSSAFNKYASEPPVIILDGKIIGYLTINTTLTNGVSPIGLEQWLENNGY